MILDLLFAAVLLGAVLAGFRRGLIQSLFWLVSLVLGILAALYGSHLTASYIERWFDVRPEYLPFFAFLGTLFLVVLLFRLLGRVMEGLFKAIRVNFLNKLAGALVWGLSATLVFSCMVWYAVNMGWVGQDLQEESQTFDALIRTAPAAMDLVGRLVPVAGDLFQQLQDWFDTTANQTVPPVV